MPAVFSEISRRSQIVALLLLAGCHVTIDDPGTDPDPSQLYFPAGIAIDPQPQNPYLFVSNHNTDLRYSGGTVMMLDRHRFHCALDVVRQVGNTPNCDHAQALIDSQTCFRDQVDPSLVDCDETPYVLADETVKVGNFAGTMILQPQPGNSHSRLLISVRGDPSITFVDVYTGPTLSANHRRIDCFSGDVPDSSGPPQCDNTRLVQEFDCTNEQASQASGKILCPMDVVNIPVEPFGMALDGNRLLVSHLSTGQVSLYDVSGNPRLVAISSPFFQANAARSHGAFALAPQHPGVPDTLWYMTSNTQPAMATFRIAQVNQIIPVQTFPVAGLSSGSDGRAILFDDGGNRAILSNNSPPSLLVLDTRVVPDSLSPSTPLNRVVDQVDSCQEASHLVRRPDGTVFAICFLSNQVMLIDPDRAQVNSVIAMGAGPNEMVLTTPAGSSIGDSYAYVTQFSESSIGVIDLNPGPTQNRMVGRIGFPTPLQ